MGNSICGLHMTSHDYANYDQFAPNFEMVHKLDHATCLCTKFVVVWAKEVGEFSITLYGKMGW